MRADDLLLGPRGRRLCHEYAQSATSLVDAITETCAWAMYWQEPDDVDTGLARDPEQLRATARVIAESPETHWWHDPVDLDNQWVVDVAQSVEELASEAPVVTRAEAVDRERAAVARVLAQRDWPDDWPDPDGEGWRIASGVWWSFPSSTASSARAAPSGGVPLKIAWEEDATGYDVARAWPVRFRPRLPVYEIDTPQDWVSLVRRYPFDVSGPARRGDWWRTTGRDGEWAVPDWLTVMADYDGVHLTVAGYLTTAGRALDVDDRFATVLAGWAPDETRWFTEVAALGEPQRWVRDDDWARG